MKSAIMQLFRLKARFIEMKITSRALEMAEEIAMWEVAGVALSHFPPRQYVSKDGRRSAPSGECQFTAHLLKLMQVK
jgi:hypothetical protein